MSKEFVQAKLAFTGFLKPVESKIKRAQTSKETEKATLNGPQRREDGENITGKSAADSKRKRGALQQGCSTSAGAGSAQQEDPPGIQPPTLQSREAKRSKKFVEEKSSSQEKPAKPNPVFALAARRCVAEANKSVRSRSALVDVTTPLKKVPQPDISRRACEISASLPPVHVLQGFCFNALDASAKNGPQRSFCRPPGLAGAVLEGNLQGHLQHENTVYSATIEVSKLLHDSIADFLWEDAASPATGAAPGDQNPGTGCRAAKHGSLPAPPDSSIAYMRTVLSHAGFQAYAHDASSAIRWKKQMACMMGNAEDFRAEQLPWTAKYAPQATEQLLSNISVSTQLRHWLSRERAEKTGPTETESCAVSSWKADSEDSEFVDSKSSKRSNGPGGMLLTGPHGSGKSAAVYACAQELHMNVLEISPGMDRSGNNLVKLVGEATQSHTVVCKGMPLEEINQPNHSEELTACKRKGRPAKSKAPKKKPTRQSKPAKNSGPPQPEQRCLTGAAPGVAHGKEPSIARSRSLLLFEDFDQLLDNEDEGFLASLSTLLLESKIPVFLLSERPDAEELLQRAVAAGAKLQTARLCSPPLCSLLEYLALVCACERVPVLPSSLMQLACACNGDLRSALNQLQLLADHCSMNLEGPIEIDGPEEQSWKGCVWALAAVPLTAPVPLSALHRAQPWQAQPHSMVWGLHEPQGSAVRADPFSMDCSATEWACSLLVEQVAGGCARQHRPSRVAPPQPDAVAQQEQQCDQTEHQQNAEKVIDGDPSGPSRSADALAGPCSGCTAQLMCRACTIRAGIQQCEREGGRILAAWSEHLRAKSSRTVRRRKRRRNAAVNGAEQEPEGEEGRKKVRVLQEGTENQKNPVADDCMAEGQENPPAGARRVEDSGASELQDDLLEDEAYEMQVDRVVAGQHVLDDDEDVGGVAMDIDEQTRPSGTMAQLGDSTDDGDVRAEPAGALGLYAAGDGDSENVDLSPGAAMAPAMAPDPSTEVPAGLSPPSETPPNTEQVPVEAASGPPGISAASDIVAGSAVQENSVQQPASLNAAALVLKKAEAAQKLYIAHLQGLAAEMQTCEVDRASEPCQHAGNVPAADKGNVNAEAEQRQPPAQHPDSGQGDEAAVAFSATSDLEAAVQAAEAASAVEALAGRRVALLDRCVDCISTTEWLWDDVSAASGVLPSAVPPKAVAATAAGLGANTNSGGVAMGLRDGVDAAALDAVLQGVHESAFACFAGVARRDDDTSMLPVVQCSVPFRRGLRLSGANVVRALRPVLHCGTRGAAVSCARAAITMAADEYTVADEQEEIGTRRSRRQRQRGYCEQLLHKFDFSLNQFSDALLGSKDNDVSISKT